MAKRDVLVLGVNDGHDAGAALIKNGKVVAAVQEERLNNIKHFTGVPEKSIFEVFNIAEAHPCEVSLIALVSYDPPGTENLQSFGAKTLLKLSPLLHSDSYIRFYANYKKNHRSFKSLRKVFEKLGLTSTETTVIEHQTAHASVAYRSSPWGYRNTSDSNGKGNEKVHEVLILTADGSGDALSSTVNIGREGKIERIAFSSYYDSLGNAFYSEITRFLGLRPWDHENKVMGLAPYGKAEYCIDRVRKIIRIDEHKPLRFQNTIGAIGSNIQPKLRKLLANQRFDNIAAAAQQHLEDLMKKWVENAIRLTGIKNVACAGGIFLNVKVNKLLRENKEVKDIFFYPAPDDEGSPVGAALQGYYEYCLREGIRPEQSPIADTYYGPSYDDEQIKEILAEKISNNKWKYELCHDIDKVAGELIVKGKILARCAGGLEWGPRALGNRSIIADPQDMRVIHKINFAIKQRDFWMPFAPSILEERKDDYLINAEFAPYMIMAFDSITTKEGGDKIPATIHPYDRTCRPQTLRREWNPHYYKIIKRFEDSTGIGAILNTSFNLHGYPMVGTPEMALWTFENSRLDALVLGNYLVSKY
jgi:carbamoyltransferase